MATFHQNLVQSFLNFKNKYLRQYDTYEDAVDDIANIPEGGIFYTNDGDNDDPIDARNITFDNGSQLGSNVYTEISNLKTKVFGSETWELLTSIETATVDKTIVYNVNFLNYSEIIFIGYGNYSSASNKWHTIERLKTEDLLFLANDTEWCSTDFSPGIPTVRIVDVSQSSSYAILSIGMVSESSFKLVKGNSTYNVTRLEIYGIPKISN